MHAETAPLLRWIVLLPLMGAALNGLLGRRLGRAAVGVTASAAVLGSFALSLAAFVRLAGADESAALRDALWPWLTVGGLRIDLAFTFDRLTAVMALVVTGVGSLIHVYSTGYMAHDASFARYFAYLNLFVFAMLTLVLGESLPLLFVGWEGVGMCSYLLIGFWFEDPKKAAAGMKAFVVNRIGDFGFLLAMFLLYAGARKLGQPTLNFSELAALAEGLAAQGVVLPGLGLEINRVTLVGLCLMLGAAGKSAQIPLFVWLPDAMAGPTPVSALIHAATMVTAGVYLFCRLNFLLVLSDPAMAVIALIGGLTAFMAATIGLVQNDIKKVLAYSTVSQLGFMFMAVGVGAWTAAMFHLVTHAFFKACLFLGSGSVIHAMHEEQDIRRMGGLGKKMPITYATFGLATLAIAGIPPFAGFFSKDEILWSVFNGRGGLYTLVWGLGIAAAFCTAFYMYRLLTLTFRGNPRMDAPAWDRVHESPASMTVALVVLAGLSVVGGWMGIPHVMGRTLPFHLPNLFAEWLAPVWVHPREIHGSAGAEWGLMALSVAVAAAGIGAAKAIHENHPEIARRLTGRFAGLHRLLSDKYRVDELYHRLVVRPLLVLSEALWRFFDARVIDGAVNGAGRSAMGLSRFLSLSQSGNVQTYAFFVVLGLLILMGWV